MEKGQSTMALVEMSLHGDQPTKQHGGLSTVSNNPPSELVGCAKRTKPICYLAVWCSCKLIPCLQKQFLTPGNSHCIRNSTVAPVTHFSRTLPTFIPQNSFISPPLLVLKLLSFSLFDANCSLFMCFVMLKIQFRKLST